MEIASILLDVYSSLLFISLFYSFKSLKQHFISASDDMKSEEVNVLRALIEDIWTTRATKIRNGLLDVINSDVTKAILVHIVSFSFFLSCTKTIHLDCEIVNLVKSVNRELNRI
jgi:hypothetical protein